MHSNTVQIYSITYTVNAWKIQLEDFRKKLSDALPIKFALIYMYIYFILMYTMFVLRAIVSFD